MTKAVKILDIAPNIGKEAMWTVNMRGKYKVGIKVIIKNAEIIYGRPHYTVEPVSGSGQVRLRDDLEIL